MNPRLLILPSIAFAVGALFGIPGEESSRGARGAETSRSSDTAHLQREAVSPQDDARREERIGRVLSAVQLRSRLKRRHDLYEAIGLLSPAELSTIIERAAKLPTVPKYEVTSALLDRWFE